MADLTRPEYGEAWASQGEKLAPVQDKMELGWVQEMMPFQYENYLQGRQDDTLLYLLQKGIPEYSATQEYIAQKSLVLYQGSVYLATQTVIGVLPSVPESWKRVSTISDAAGVVTVAGGGTGATSVAQARTNLGLGSASVLNADFVVQKDSNGDFSARVITASLAGNAASADKLKTPRQISLSGSVTSNAVPFDGSSNLVLPVTSIDAGGLTSGTVPVERLGNTVTKTSSTGFARLPAGESTERGTPEKAGFRFNTSLNVPEYYDGNTWQATTATRSDLLGGYRFETTIWAGRAGNLPEGFAQCSGQQTLDITFSNLRRDVVTSQPFCTEAEWQADPYKRVTHWSLGDGDEATGGWMRPPDKNGVQPGNVGAFYGAGSNPAGAKTGTAVIDAMRNIRGTLKPLVYGPENHGSGVFTTTVANRRNLTTSTTGPGLGESGQEDLEFDASRALPAGTTTDPVTGEFRPRTWYGIWMIRMYGRVTNVGDLNAPALSGRMDLIDARVATLEGRQKALGDGQTMQTVSKTVGVNYTNTSGRTMYCSITALAPGSARSFVAVSVGGVARGISHYGSTGSMGVSASGIVFAGETYYYSSENVNNIGIKESL